MDGIERCGPGVCFTMGEMTLAQVVRFTAPARSLRYVTKPSGDPRQARHSDQGVTVGWSLRQQAAARQLEALWVSGLKGWTGPGGHRSGGTGGEGMTDEQLAQIGRDKAEAEAALQAVARECSAAHAGALRMAVIEHQPSSLGRAGLVREGLSFLADWWGMK